MKLKSIGIREGDYIIAIQDQDVRWSKHVQVVEKIRSHANTVKLTLVNVKPISKEFQVEEKTKEQLSPTKAKTRPAYAFRSMPFRTSTGPKLFLTPASSITGPSIAFSFLSDLFT